MLLFHRMAHICAALNGALATIILSAALIPALWFPAYQRVTATGKLDEGRRQAT